MRARDEGVDVVLLATVAAAALLGGILAVLLLYILGPLQPRIMLFVVIVVTLLAVLAVGTLQTDPHRTTATRPRPPRPPQPQARWAPPPVQPPPLPAYARAAPVLPRAQAVSRQVFTPPPPPDPAPPPDTRPPAYEVRRLTGAPSDRVRRIVQCPGCGDFDIDLSEAGGELSFACRNRGHRWTWAPGRPWPATVVRPPAAPVRNTDRA